MQKENNRIVKNGMWLGLCIVIVYYAIAYFIFPRFSTDVTIAGRLALAIQSLVFPTLMFFIGVIWVGKQRYGNPADDPTKVNASTEKMKVDLCYLTNTHEQLSLFSLATLGLSIYAQPEHLHLVPINALLFVLGRIVFWACYHINVLYRAPGFCMTIMPSVISLFYGLFYWLKQWF